jgi:DNA repair exonuclease SbcCD nuclease subunit
MSMGRDALRLAHISDTHIGYEAYRSISASGENQRGEDVVRVFHTAVSDICEWDPPLVIHSGDVAEKPKIPVRHMLFIKSQLTKLAAIRADGSRRQVVVIAGNHDIPAQRREPCYLELYRDIPGVHIVTDDVARISFENVGEQAGPSEELANVQITAVPHDTLKDLALEERFGEITPAQDKVNILVAHGVAGVSKLFKRILGREFSIPTEVLGAGWEYGALGHWHKQGPINLSVTSDNRKEPKIGRVWYAGSTENMGCGDLKDNGLKRGWLAVNVTAGAVPEVDRRWVHGRKMIRLPVLEGDSMSAEQIQADLIGRIREQNSQSPIAGAVVGQIVKGVTRDIWSLVDVAAVRTAAGSALHYEVNVEPIKTETLDDSDSEVKTLAGLAEMEAALTDIADEVLKQDDSQIRTAALGLAKKELAREIKTVTDGESAEVKK